MINLSNTPVTIVNGDRIAQAVLMPVYCKELVTLQPIEDFTVTTERGSSGFGSSGYK